MKQAFISVTAASLLLASCSSGTGTGALAGGGGGAVIGGVVGGWQGAVIGGVAGAAAGALIGYALDEHERATMSERSPDTLNRIDNQQQLTLQDIKNMSRNGLSDNTIINQIKATNSTFNLSSDQIVDLKKAGVSNKVIEYMQSTAK